MVDDEEHVRRALARELAPWAEANRLSIISASSPAEAKDALARPSPEVCLLLSDVHMSGWGGIELVKHARAAHPKVISLLLTGYSDFPELMSAIQAGVFSYILKPWDSDYLRAEEQAASRLVEDMQPAGGYSDDVTILTARFNPSEAGPGAVR